jgi:GDPmannose 4,6-dehydratase
MLCSTSEVYGNSINEGEKINELAPLVPHNPYGASKAACDLYLQERFTNSPLKGYITRSFSHTGPRRGKIFSISSDAYQIALMKLGKQEKILKVGNLDSIRVVVDVRDIVSAYYLLMINDGSDGEIYNICGDIPRRMGEYTEFLMKASKVEDIVKEICPKLYRPIDIHFQDGDCSKLKKLTGWEPQYTIEQTTEDLLNYWVKKLG